MKAHRSLKGDEVAIFRLKDHYERFLKSAKRMLMPPVPETHFVYGMIELVRKVKEYIPTGKGNSLYIRPFMFSIDPMIRIQFPGKFLFSIIASPSGAYYSKPVSLRIETQFVRACRGGTGNIKCGGNYGASIYPHYLAVQDGFDQVLWTDAHSHKYIEEVGTMNIFVRFRDEIATPSLDTETILPGITRDSVIQILKFRGINVNERPISVDELVSAAENNSLIEIFGTGTAATITPVSSFSYKGRVFKLRTEGEDLLAPQLKETLDNIKHGIDVPENFKHWLTIV